MKFNELQKKIIDHVEGAYLISAPVGTGKTTVLAERVLRAIEGGIKPEEILCLTFTNRAAEEMQERLKRKLKTEKDVFGRLVIRTFHGFCAYFCRQEAKALDLNQDFTIIDDDEQMELMERVLEKYPSLSASLGERRASAIRDLFEKIYQWRLRKLEIELGWKKENTEIDEECVLLSAEYLDGLAGQNALDFNELVLKTIQALYFNEGIKAKWTRKFRFIQLDEFQDTHVSEYLVVKQLARVHKNIALIGDLDQTIYGWRGSDPHFIADQFKKHFAPVNEFFLEVNYRFNPEILEAVKSFLSNLERRHTKNMTSSGAVDSGGEKCVDVFSGYGFDEEVGWVADSIKDIRQNDPTAGIAVLSRVNYLIQEAASVFERKGIAHVTVDKYDFFRRQEVKDILACLKVVYNRYDLDSAYRLTQRPARNIGASTLKAIINDGSPFGLKISDFLTLKNYNYSEPFERLIRAHEEGRIVVLDTETTGTNPYEDEIVQIYALEIVGGKPGREFHEYIKNTRSVGSSEEVHGLSDEFLSREGGEPKAILERLKDFLGRDAVSGHNVMFDLNMIIENGKRNGITFEFPEFYDTLDLSRRLVESPNYKLGTLAKIFSLAEATHSADDDVKATVGLLAILVEKLKMGIDERKELFSRFGKKFLQLAMLISNWQKTVREKRPPEALLAIWEDSGLKEYYEKGGDRDKRLKSFETLLELFYERDDKGKRPDIAMRENITFSSLSKNIDFLGIEKGKVPIVTVHQVKGLEFDYVFIIGMNEFRFPLHRQDMEEEKRLFYVALTRARKKIFLSYSKFDSYNRPLAKSRFIDLIDGKYVSYL